MKKIYKMIAMLLALVMLTSTFCVTALADTTADLSCFTKGSGYLAFGDSIARGYGASDKWFDEGYTFDLTDNPYCRNVTGSYTKLVAEAIGCSCPNDIRDTTATYWPMAQDAVTTAFVLDYLGVDDNYRDTEYLYAHQSIINRYNTMLYYFGDEMSMNLEGTGRYGRDGTVDSICDLIANSSLITTAIGMGDVWNRSRDFAQQGVDLTNLTTEAVTGVVTELVERMYEGFSYWKQNYPLVLNYFKENAPNATVVIVGTINPAFNMTLSSESLYPIGTAFSVISSSMNALCQQWAKEYGFLYVDISNVETGTTENPVGLMELFSATAYEQGLATHPTPEGYRQISRLILSALQDEVADRQPVWNEIRVDLGRIKSVSDVRVNGLSTNNYRMDGDVLTVYCDTPFAKTLAVSSVGKDGKIASTVYTLSYNNGYTAHRTYTTNDTAAVVQSAKKQTVSAATSLVKKAGSLFSKLWK